MFPRRIKFAFVHGLVFGFELFEYPALSIPDDVELPEDWTVEDVLQRDDVEIKQRSGLIVHIGPIKMVLF